MVAVGTTYSSEALDSPSITDTKQFRKTSSEWSLVKIQILCILLFTLCFVYSMAYEPNCSFFKKMKGLPSEKTCIETEEVGSSS